MKIGITCYPTFGGSGVVATELGVALADRGDEVHFISYALPSRLELPRERVHFHEVVAPSYPLFVSPPYTLALATKMAEVAARAKLDLLHVHYALPHAISAILAREMGNGNGVAPEGRDDAPRHRRHDRGHGPLVPPDHALGNREERRGHRGLDVPSRRDRPRVRNQAADRGPPELRRPASVPSGRRLRLRARDRAPRGRGPRPRLEFPSGQAHPRRARGLRPRAPEDPGASAPRRRRSRALSRRTARSRGRASRTARPSSGTSPRSRRSCRRRDCSSCRRTPSRSVSRRSRRWPAACRSSARRRAACPRSSRTAGTATCVRSATSTGWRAERSSSSRTRRCGPGSPPPCRLRAEREFPTETLVRRYRALYEATLAG